MAGDDSDHESSITLLEGELGVGAHVMQRRDPVNRAEAPECPSSRAALHPRSFVIATPHLISGPIKRPAVTLLVSLNARPFNVAVPGFGGVEAHAAFVGAGQERVLRARNCDLLSVNIEPGHVLFRPLQQALGERPLQRVPAAREVLDLLQLCFKAVVPGEPHLEILVELCENAGFAVDRSLRPRNRANELMATVDDAIPGRASLSQLANTLRLSESRLSHLFVEEVGVPLRTYLLWRRYRLALSRLSSQTTFTQLASDTGFADAAHLTRTFVGYLGFSPRRVVNSCFIQDLASR